MPQLHFRHLSALLPITLTFYYVFHYPYAKFILGAILGIYTVVSLIKPKAWLLVIPTLLPLLSLAPWSGRFFLEEFDFFILITIATAIWRGDYSLNRQLRLATIPSILIGLLLLSHCIALVRGLMPFPTIDANSFNNYYSPYNAFRVGKAFFWALLLIPPSLSAFANSREQAREYLGLGVCLGLLGTAAAILWERGVFWDVLYGTDIWARLQSLTNFSSEYRATGLFADMHTGGEAIDGYLAMAWPFALGLLLTHSHYKSLATGVITLPLGLYSALVTFSRGTYMAVAVSLATFGLGQIKKLAHIDTGGKPVWPIPAALLAAMSICVFLYGKGGWHALIAALIILGGTIALTFIKNLRLEWLIAAIGGLFLAGSLLMMRGLLTSKWVSNDRGDSFLTTLLVASAMLASGAFIGNRTRQFMSFKGLLVSLAIALSVVAVCVPIASGSYIKSRFSTTEGDLGGRMSHWQHAIDIMDPSLDTSVFGMGLGVFPRAYAWGGTLGGGMENTSIVRLEQDALNTNLKLSTTMDLTLGQRVNLEAGQNYTLSVDVRTPVKQGMFGLSICRRNILYPTLWNPNCIYYEKTVENQNGQWQTLTWQFNIGNLGDGFQAGRRPLILRISNGLPQNVTPKPGDHSIECDNIKLLDNHGEDLISNGNFESELDRWYIYTDFYHLPMHIKNLWVTAYFEQGLFGLLAFAALSLYSLMVGVCLVLRGDNFATTVVASLLGFFSVGLIGTLLDVPRVSFLFFLLQFILLAQDPAPAIQKVRR